MSSCYETEGQTRAGHILIPMGHANIVMTLNYYAHATFHSAQAEMERLEAKPETTVENTEETTEEAKAAA